MCHLLRQTNPPLASHKIDSDLFAGAGQRISLAKKVVTEVPK
jgi:hypothetical protein